MDIGCTIGTTEAAGEASRARQTAAMMVKLAKKAKHSPQQETEPKATRELAVQAGVNCLIEKQAAGGHYTLRVTLGFFRYVPPDGE